MAPTTKKTRTVPQIAKASPNVKTITKSQKPTPTVRRAEVQKVVEPEPEQPESPTQDVTPKQKHPKKKPKRQNFSTINFRPYIRAISKLQAPDCSMSSGALNLIDALSKQFVITCASNGYDVCGSTLQGIQTFKATQADAGIQLTIRDPELREEICSYSRLALGNWHQYKAQHEKEE